MEFDAQNFTAILYYILRDAAAVELSEIRLAEPECSDRADDDAQKDE
jgi:hypothetical protein